MARVRYVIIGAGAVGGTIGACLFQAGQDVILVARGAHLDALRARGLRLATPLGTSTLAIPAVGGPAEVGLQPGDTLILTSKTQDAAALLDEWAWQPVSHGTVAADTLPVVCAQNGVASERFALRRFRHAPVSQNVMRWKYGKLLDNLNNAIEALCGRDASGFATVADTGDAAELRRLVRDEGTAVLAIAGFDYSTAAELAGVRRDSIRIEPVNGSARVGGSSWQSLTRQTGTIEANFLNGEIVLLGRQYDVPTPVNEALQRLANQAALERMPPGSLSPTQVLAVAGVGEAQGDTGLRSG